MFDPNEPEVVLDKLIESDFADFYFVSAEGRYHLSCVARQVTVIGSSPGSRRMRMALARKAIPFVSYRKTTRKSPFAPENMMRVAGRIFTVCSSTRWCHGYAPRGGAVPQAYLLALIQPVENAGGPLSWGCGSCGEDTDMDECPDFWVPRSPQ